MLSIQSRSVVFKFMLAGLLALLVASQLVDAAPTGKPAAKAVAKPAAKAPVSAPKVAAPAKAPAAKKCLLKKSGGLRKRAGVVHPDGKSSVVLFHGTHDAGNAQALQKPSLARTSDLGDLHDNKKYGVCGGFYLTDSIIAAAQFVCHREGAPTKATTAYVVSYQWTPPAGLSLYSFPDSATWQQITPDKCKANGMITAPMHVPFTDKNLSADFRQYAIVQQALLDNNLKYLKTYTVPCANVYKGSDLPAEQYSQGQAANPEFPVYTQQLEKGC